MIIGVVFAHEDSAGPTAEAIRTVAVAKPRADGKVDRVDEKADGRAAHENLRIGEAPVTHQAVTQPPVAQPAELLVVRLPEVPFSA
jgi:hypothetical protein